MSTLPRIGVLDGEDVKKLNFLIVIFVAAAISTGEILRESGALQLITTVAFGWLEPFVDNPWEAVPVLYWTGFVYHIFLGDEISMLATRQPCSWWATHSGASHPATCSAWVWR